MVKRQKRADVSAPSKSAGQKGAGTKARQTKKRKTKDRKSIRIIRIIIFNNALSPCKFSIMDFMIISKKYV